MDSSAETNHSTDDSRIIDEKTLLQVNGSMVVGVLFLLTLTAFISLPEIYGRVLIGVFTLVIIFPFVASWAILLLAKNEKKKEKLGRRRMWWLEKVLGAPTFLFLGWPGL